MSDAVARTRACIEAHWATANDRDWPSFAALLAPDLHYRAPQTREYLDGAEGYLDMFRTWPGDWRAVVRELICEAEVAVSRIDFVVGAETMTGLSFFRLDAAGHIAEVTDWWPEPYEPPPRVTAWLKREPAA